MKEGLSENELSRRIGISQQVLNRMIAGINLNPKLTTISPIALYFNVPLQELIYGDLSCVHNKISAAKVPFINFSDLQKYGIEISVAKAHQFVSVDMEKNKGFFATEMYDNSMEPKFPLRTILIFEQGKEPFNGDFCLLRTEDNNFLFRQVLFNITQKKYVKCLNPNFEEYKVVPMPVNFYILATLLEARTNFIFR